MAITFEVQKPGKTRAKNSSAEQFITTADTGLVKGKRILEEIQAIVQNNRAGNPKKTTESEIIRGQSKTALSKAGKTTGGTTKGPNIKGQSTNEDKGATRGQSCNRFTLKKEPVGQKVSNPKSRNETTKEGQRCRTGQKVSNPKLLKETKIRLKVSNLIGGQQCRKERRAAMPLKDTGSSQKVCTQVSMMGLEPGRESSALTEPVNRPSRGNPKLEEQSVGGSVALSPRSPDVQQTRFPGGSTKPPVVEGTGLVDGAASPEKPDKARKPGPRQVSIKVSRVSKITKRAKRLQRRMTHMGS